MKATTKSAKQVQIVATYYHKNVETGALTGVVTYLVRASNGVDTYTTTLVNGKATGCSCPSRSKNGCYHKHGLEQKAVARKEVASQFSAKHAPSWLVELVAKGVLVAPVKVVSKPTPTVVDLPEELKGHRKTMRVKGDPIVRKDPMNAPLTRNSGFSLLKRAV